MYVYIFIYFFFLVTPHTVTSTIFVLLFWILDLWNLIYKCSEYYFIIFPLLWHICVRFVLDILSTNGNPSVFFLNECTMMRTTKFNNLLISLQWNTVWQTIGDKFKTIWRTLCEQTAKKNGDDAQRQCQANLTKSVRSLQSKRSTHAHVGKWLFRSP